MQEQIRSPEPLEFFSVSANNAGSQSLLCYTLLVSETEAPSLNRVNLCIGGGFSEETKTVNISHGTSTPVPELESTQEEADTRIVLHAIYSAIIMNTLNAWSFTATTQT